MSSQLLDILVALSPILLAVILILSTRPRYRAEIAHDRDTLRERDETIVALHYCREHTAKMEQELAGLRWLVSTYGIKSATRLPAMGVEPADSQVNSHITAALQQERNNLAFLQEQVARYGDSDLVRHNQIEAIGKRIKELESILDAYALAPA